MSVVLRVGVVTTRRKLSQAPRKLGQGRPRPVPPSRCRSRDAKRRRARKYAASPIWPSKNGSGTKPNNAIFPHRFRGGAGANPRKSVRRAFLSLLRAPGSGAPIYRQVPGRVSIMNWFFIALWAPFLLACANHNDKFLLSRYLKEKNVGSIAIVSSLFSGVAIPVVLFIRPEAYDVSLVQGGALIATGMASVVAALCYLHALNIDEASFVTPFYQTVPVFAYVLG